MGSSPSKDWSARCLGPAVQTGAAERSHGGRAGMHPAGLSKTGSFLVPTPERWPRGQRGGGHSPGLGTATPSSVWLREAEVGAGRQKELAENASRNPDGPVRDHTLGGSQPQPQGPFQEVKRAAVKGGSLWGGLALLLSDTPTPPLSTLPLQGHLQLHGGLGGWGLVLQGPPVPAAGPLPSSQAGLGDAGRQLPGAEDEEAPPHSDNRDPLWGWWDLGADEKQGHSGLVISGLNTSV